jgi:hypothetical protein
MQPDDAFQHIATFYSLIVGLAVANVLGAIGKTARTNAQVRWHWLHAAAAAMLLLLIAQDWWFLLSWDGVMEVNHAVLVFLLARAGLLYFASNLLIPEPDQHGDARVDLRMHMSHIRPRFCAVLAVFPILDLTDTLLKGSDRLAALPYYPVYVAAFFGLMTAAALARTERVAAVAVVTMLCGLGLTVIGSAFGIVR